MMSCWDVKRAIEDDVNKYMIEYLKHPDVQKRIKRATEETVDKLMNGVIETIIATSQDAIKSNYKNFIEKKEK